MTKGTSILYKLVENERDRGREREYFCNSGVQEPKGKVKVIKNNKKGKGFDSYSHT